MNAISINSVLDMSILHCCAERGVHYKIFLEKPLDIERINKDKITNLNLVKNDHSGFFRFYLAGFITVSGTYHECNFSVLFSFFRLKEAIEELEILVPGFKEIYKDLKNFPS